ncbi:hypothetical protein JW968_00625 [Candidatus Woesearchaeota archaeon]|nr:hypothetical protein [Candidatus Woesearchaeota archaeon]
MPGKLSGVGVIDLEKRDANVPGDFEALHMVLKRSFHAIREEMDDHREAINENTREIQENSVVFSDFDARLAKLEERMDELQLMIHSLPKAKEEIFLDEVEAKVFLVLYTFSIGSPLSLQDIARRANLTELKVRQILRSIMEKGIIVRTNEVDNTLFYELDDAFAARHAKHSIVRMESVSLNAV